MFKSILFSAAIMASTLVFGQKDVVDVAMSSKNHTTLVAAIKAADLVGVLKSEGPFTVFAPTNAAFDKLPEGTVSNLLKPENKEKLQAVLKYHVVPGKLTADKVLAAIKGGNNTATLTTVQGQEISASVVDGKVQITDAAGNKSMVTATDLKGSNGVIHVIDTVLLPK